jgi:hypothetical protein
VNELKAHHDEKTSRPNFSQLGIGCTEDLLAARGQHWERARGKRTMNRREYHNSGFAALYMQ